MKNYNNSHEQTRWQEIINDLQTLKAPEVPAGLAERAYRAAIGYERNAGFAERFVFVARRALVFGTLTAAFAWIVLIANQNSAVATYDPAGLPLDAEEHGVALWMEGGP